MGHIFSVLYVAEPANTPTPGYQWSFPHVQFMSVYITNTNAQQSESCLMYVYGSLNTTLTPKNKPTSLIMDENCSPIMGYTNIYIHVILMLE